MSIAVVIAFAGALAAAVGTGALAGRLIREPRSDFAAWSCVMLALAVALGAQAMGFALGFKGTTFRAAEVSGLLLAPLWTAWGIVELAGQSVAARFGARLVTAALTVVPGVIMIADPLASGAPFGKAWPGSVHYQALPRSALTGIHIIVVAVALVVMTITAVRTRRDPAWWDVFVPVAVAGAAVLLTVSLGLTLPAIGYPLLAAASAGLVWFAAKRAERVDVQQMRAAHAPPAVEPARGRRRRGRASLDINEPGQFDDAARDSLGALAAEQAADGLAGGWAGGSAPGARHGAMPNSMPGYAPDPTAASARTPGLASPSAASPSAVSPSAALAGAASGAALPSRLFGLIAIYTLVDGQGEDFDRLAERTVEAVRRHEPDTLVFVVHTVPNAPLQRIFYEVYRDRMAYKEHRQRPQIEEFFAKHRPYVLATNVIELDLQYAKVSALPSLAALLAEDAGGARAASARGVPAEHGVPPGQHGVPPGQHGVPPGQHDGPSGASRPWGPGGSPLGSPGEGAVSPRAGAAPPGQRRGREGGER
jgi:quinol monooxygenase YgiN